MQKVVLADIADKLEKIDLWKIYFDTETGGFIEFSEDYDAASQEVSEEEILRHVFEVEDNWGRYVALPSSYDVDEHAIMKSFAAAQTDESDRRVLQEALAGSGSLRHFCRTVRELMQEAAWGSYRRQAFFRIAEDWCIDNDIPYRQ